MSAPNANTFSLPSPRRPGTDDFNGIAKVDDAAFPPDPQTHPNAGEWNTIEFLVVALGRVCPLLVISSAAGGAYVSHKAPSEEVSSGTFTFANPSTGVVEITWAANTFPPSLVAPLAALNGGPGQIWAELISNGVRVHTYDGTGTAANKPFTVSIY